MKSTSLRRESRAGPASSLWRSPVKCQHLKDLRPDHKGAKTGHCQDPENHHHSKEETKGQAQKTGGGRRGHLIEVLRGGAVTLPFHLHPHWGAVSFWDWIALLPLPLPLPPGPVTATHLHQHHTTQHTSCCRAPVASSFTLVLVPHKTSYPCAFTEQSWLST